MQLSSTAFSDGTAIPSRHTCDGEDISPPLGRSDPPAGTRSFVLLCDDHDAPDGTWHHWAAYDIPANLTSLAPGAARRIDRLAFKQAVNDFQNIGYGGPCPPPQHGLHHYNFRLLALSVDRLAVEKSHPAWTSPAKPASMSSLRRLSSAFMNDSDAAAGPATGRPRLTSKDAQPCPQCWHFSLS